MRENDYAIIQGWMYALPLTDKQRLAYAIIWNYSRDGRSVCRTTAAHLSEWLTCSERNAKYIIRQLETLGLIEHQVVAVPKRRNHPGGLMTDFWAVLPDSVSKPDKKERINWTGKGGKVGKPVSLPGREAGFPTPYKSIKSTNNSNCGGGKNKRARAEKVTTTTTSLSLFENESGLAPGKLPYEEDYFRKAWEMLLKQPAWAGKTPEQLQIVLDRLAYANEPAVATYAVNLAIERSWDNINDLNAIVERDHERILAFTQEIEWRAGK